MARQVGGGVPHSWVPHALAVYFPFVVAFLVREVLLGWEFNLIREDWSYVGMSLAIKWFTLTPFFAYHYPTIPSGQLGGLYLLLTGPVDFDQRTFALVGQAVNLALLAAVGAWVGRFVHIRGGSPVWLLAVAAATATMPAMVRFAGLWAPHFSLGILLMGAGVASSYALSSRFADRTASYAAAIMLGLAFTQMFLAATAIVAFGAVGLVLAATSASAREGLFGAGASAASGLRRALVFIAAVALATAVIGLLTRMVYEAAGRYWLTLAVMWGLSLLSLIPGFRLPASLGPLAAAALLQGIGFSLALLGQAHLNSPSITYPHVVFSIFPSVLVVLALWRTSGFRGVMFGPLGAAAIAVVCSANIVAPYLVDAMLGLVEYKETYHRNRITELSQVLGADLVAWDLFLAAMPLAVVVLFGLGREARREWPAGLAVLILVAGIVASSYDLLLAPFSRPDDWGYRERFMMPLLFALPLAFRLACDAGWSRPTLALALVLSGATLVDFARLDLEPARQTHRAHVALVDDAVARGRAEGVPVRLVCGQELITPACRGVYLYSGSLEGEDADMARRVLDLSQDFRGPDGVTFTVPAYAVRNPPPDDEVVLYVTASREESADAVAALKGLPGDWAEIPSPPGSMILRRAPLR